MDFGLMESVARQAAALGTPRVLLTGGEPLSYRHIVRCVELISSLGMKPVISTSGIGLDAAMCRALSAAGLSRIYVSLNGSGAEVHGLSRTRYDDAVRAIRAAVSCGLNCGVNWVSRGDNADDFPELVKLCDALGVREVCALSCKKRGGCVDSPATPGNVRALADFIRSYPKRDFFSVDLCYPRLNRALGRDVSKFHRSCPAGRYFFDVASDGAMLPCRHRTDTTPAPASLGLARYWASLAGVSWQDRCCV